MKKAHEACVQIGSSYAVGSMPPAGYVEWFAWAKAQHRGGLRQAICPCCGLWLFPQEANDHASRGVEIVEEPK